MDRDIECHRLFAELVIKIRAIVEQSFLRATEPTLLRPFEDNNKDFRDDDWDWKFNSNVCNSCWNDVTITGHCSSGWSFCPRNKNFECSSEITSEMVIQQIQHLL